MWNSPDGAFGRRWCPDGRRSFTCDEENQLASVIVTNGVNDSTKSEFVYDGLSRLRIRKESRWQGGVWAQTAEVRYVYDGRLAIQERDGNNVPTVTYTRGLDLSGSREGAGGIGGLLARTDQTTIVPSHAYYHADGNGNVTAMINGQHQIAARYHYDPYGNVLAMSGPLAEANVYRFSSKEAHAASGLSYYLYRFYEPNLQRWINRDPIGERGGMNLYGFVRNSPSARVDPSGLFIWDEEDDFPVLTGNPMAAYLYDFETKQAHDEIMADGWNALRDGGGEVFIACLPFGVGKLGRLRAVPSIIVESVLCEIGGRFIPDDEYRRGYDGLSDAAKGRKLIKEKGIVRAVFPQGRGWFLAWGTEAWRKGPTRAVKYGGPVLGPGVGYLIYRGVRDLLWGEEDR